MTSILKAAGIAALTLLAGPVAAQDAPAGPRIENPVIYETTPVARTAAGYMTVTNTRDASDALLGVQADFPRVMLHESVESDGVMTMPHVERVEIPAGGEVSFAPGGLHVMFMGLSAPLKAGQRVPTTLTFEHGGEVAVDFEVRARPGAAGRAMPGGQMDHGAMKGDEIDHGEMNHGEMKGGVTGAGEVDAGGIGAGEMGGGMTSAH